MEEQLKSNRPRVYITRQMPEEGLRRVLAATDARRWEGDEPVPREVLLRGVAEVEGLLSMLTDRIDAQVLDAAPRLRVVSNLAVGYDNIDVPAATARGVLIGHTPGVLTETTADLAFALLLAVARRLPESADYVRSGQWTTWHPLLLLGHDVHGATLGIIGLGRIGAAVARRSRGFGMRILYTSSGRRHPERERELGARWVELGELLRESDFVSLHVPLIPATRGLIGADELRQMKPSAFLINTSRGPVVDAHALYAAVRAGQIAGAGLDVTDPEPIPPDDPLLTLPNVLILPHIGSATVATRARMAEMAADNLLAGLRGEVPPHCVNPEAAGRR